MVKSKSTSFINPIQYSKEKEDKISAHMKLGAKVHLGTDENPKGLCWQNLGKYPAMVKTRKGAVRKIGNA